MIRWLGSLVAVICALGGFAQAQTIDARGVLQLQQQRQQQQQQQQATPQPAERRVALVIGNSSYRHIGRLRNPQADAEVMARFLATTARFELIGGGAVVDADRAQMVEAIRAFGRQLQAGGVGLFYYAGHGIEWRGANYLIPVEANPIRDSDIEFDLVSANSVLNQMEQAGSRLNMLILDACRNNPLLARGFRSASNGLQAMRAAAGTIVSFAAEPGALALDGDGANSPFNMALVSAMSRPGVNVLDVFNQVGLEVSRATNGRQIPWVNSSPIEGQFFFSGAPAPPPQVAAAPPAPAAAGGQTRQLDTLSEVTLWSAIRNSSDPAEFEGFLRVFPNGAFAGAARQALARLRGEDERGTPPDPTAPPAPASPIRVTTAPTPPAAPPQVPQTAAAPAAPTATPPAPPPPAQTTPAPVANAPQVAARPPAEPAVRPVSRTMVAGRTVPLYAEARADARRLGSVPAETVLAVTATTEVAGETWLRTTWRGRAAWLRDDHVQAIDAAQAQAWERLRRSSDADALDEFAERYESGPFAGNARRRAAALRAAAAAPRPAQPEPQPPQRPAPAPQVASVEPFMGCWRSTGSFGLGASNRTRLCIRGGSGTRDDSLLLQAIGADSLNLRRDQNDSCQGPVSVRPSGGGVEISWGQIGCLSGSQITPGGTDCVLAGAQMRCGSRTFARE